MAQTYRNYKDLRNKVSAVHKSLEEMSKRTSARHEATRQFLYDSQMRMSATLKELAEKLQHDRAIAIGGSEHQLQKVIDDRLGNLPKSTVEKLLAPNNDSGDLAVGEGTLDDGVRANLIKVLEKMSAGVEEFESLFQPYTNFFRDANDTNIFADGNGKSAPEVDYIQPFPFPSGNTAHGVDYTKLFPLADGNTTRDVVVDCRHRAVIGCTRQADCTFGESNGTLTRELAKCDALANVNIFDIDVLAGTFAVLFVVAFMLCLALRLLSERQVSNFGLAVIAVCLVIRFSGI